MNMQEMIQRLHEDLGAEIVQSRTKGLYSPYQALIKFKNWPVTIRFGRTVSVKLAYWTYTTITAAFVPRDKFKFAISYRRFLSMFSKPRPIVYPELAGRDVCTTTNDETNLGKILENSNVREFLVKIFDHGPGSGVFHMGPESIFITGADRKHRALVYEKRSIQDIVWDENVDTIKNVYELFKEILVHLAALGSISEESCEPYYRG